MRPNGRGRSKSSALSQQIRSFVTETLSHASTISKASLVAKSKTSSSQLEVGKEQRHLAEAVVTILHPAGLHLRPAAQFVQTAARFASTVRIKNLSRSDAPDVDAKSMFGMMHSGASSGHQIRIRAEGPDAEAAIKALTTLVERNFEDA